MANLKPVVISKAAYAFCRYTIAISIWISVIFRIKELLLAVVIILILSAILKVRRAPLIVLYTYTINKLFPSRNVVVNEKGIRFAHIVGAVVGTMCLLLIYFVNPISGWLLTVFLAILKTSAALGFCSALKLYECVSGGGDCCNIGKLVKKTKEVNKND